MKRKPAPAKYSPRPIDLSMQGLFYDALEQTEMIPEQDRWEYVMELLPDTFHYYILLSSQQPEKTMMDRVGPLAIMLAETFVGDDYDAYATMLAFNGLILSSVAELERKSLSFCESVDAISDPFFINLDGLSPFHPKVPENFSVKEMIAYHIAQYKGSDL